MNIQTATAHPVKTGYFRKEKKSWKKGRTTALHCALFVKWSQKLIFLYEKAHCYTYLFLAAFFRGKPANQWSRQPFKASCSCTGGYQ
jgi:hypothetical protein